VGGEAPVTPVSSPDSSFQTFPTNRAITTPSNDKKNHAYAKDNPPSVAPQLQKTKITKTRAKRVSLTREQVMLS
jgi:hypothetical protein